MLRSFSILSLALASASQLTACGGSDVAPICVHDVPLAEAPAELRGRGEIEIDEEFAPFSKQLTVHGLTLVAHADVPDAFLEAVGDTIEEMFPDPSTDPSLDAAGQAEILSAMHRYRAALPVFHGEHDPSASEGAAITSLSQTHSVCDVIFEGTPRQPMEVVEHLLHATTDVGFHHALEAGWGLREGSEVDTAMTTAIAAGIYDVRSYRGIDERTRVEIQEFAYWLITTAWDLQTKYGPDEQEWTLRTPEQLESELPDAWTLFSASVPDVMRSPSESTLDALDAWGG